MASIQPHPGGRWRVQVAKLGVRESRVFDSKRQAENWGATREAEILAGARGELPKKSLLDALRRYSADVSPKKRGARWEQLRLEMFERSVPCAREIIHEITKADIAAWRDARLELVKGATVRREWNLLSNVFKVAINEWGWARENPMRTVTRPPESRPRERRITPLEVRRICRRLGWKSGPPENLSQEIALAFLVALRTAMRAGEILSLKPENIDLKNRVAWLDMTKNGERRGVPLTRHGARLLAIVKTHPFTVSAGTRDALFREARKAAGVEGATFHDSRGEAATRLSKKVDLMTLAKILGHKDINVTFETYYRETPEDMAKRM